MPPPRAKGFPRWAIFAILGGAIVAGGLAIVMLTRHKPRHPKDVVVTASWSCATKSVEIVAHDAEEAQLFARTLSSAVSETPELKLSVPLDKMGTEDFIDIGVKRGEIAVSHRIALGERPHITFASGDPASGGWALSLGKEKLAPTNVSSAGGVATLSFGIHPLDRAEATGAALARTADGITLTVEVEKRLFSAKSADEVKRIGNIEVPVEVEYCGTTEKGVLTKTVEEKDVLAMIDPGKTGAAWAPAYVKGSKPPMLVKAWNGFDFARMQGKPVGDAQLLLTSETDSVHVGDCGPYGDYEGHVVYADHTRTIEKLTVVEMKTGKQIAKTTLYGPFGECPYSVTSYSGGSSASVSEGGPSDEQINAWLDGLKL